jgi:hypothetical protein
MADSDPNPTTTPNIASPEGAYPNYYSPAEIPKLVQFLTSMSGGGMPGGAPVNHNDTANQFIQFLTSMAGGGMGAPGGGFGGRSPVMPPSVSDALGIAAGPMGDPLGMFAMGAGGLYPYQAADLRLQRRNRINALNQRMANQHRGVGRFGGTDYSRHIQNIDDEMMALQNQAMQLNIQNAFRASQEALAWARFNQSQDQDYWERLLRFWTAMGLFGGAGQQAQQGGTASSAQPTVQTGTTPGTSWG